MCEDLMCLSRLSPTRGRGNGGMDIYILKLTSGLYLKSGESIMTVPLDTFWIGIQELAKSGAVPRMSGWRNGNVSGLALTWPLLQNCTQLVLDSRSIVKLQVRDQNEAMQSLGHETYYVPTISETYSREPLVSLECQGVS